jgi:endo-1,4-beta-xylanase
MWRIARASLSLLAYYLMLLVIPATDATAAEPSAAELLAGADARIEQHRKADATIMVVDAAGKPLAGAEIDVRQTRHAFLFGSNIFLWGKLPDEKNEQSYRRRFAELLNYATLPFYWFSYERRRGEPNHQYVEEVARWCQQQGIQTKGHPLAWNFADAPWFPDDANELYRLQLGRIDDCVRRFRGLIDYWDVVNEATHYDRADFLKNAPKHTTMWKSIGQTAFARECFRHARHANHTATLLINDYRTDPAYQRVIEQLADQDNQRLYDAIGIQSHMHGGVWPVMQIWSVCQQFARFGVPLHFTETTILSGEHSWEKKGDWPSTPEGEASQAQEVAQFYTMLFSHPAVQAITWWDFSDYHAWQAAPAGLLRKDMTPKPAYDELKKLVKGKWWTTIRLRSDKEGKAAFRGFLGSYRLTARAGNRPPIVIDVVLTRNKTNACSWTVKIQ